MSKIGKKPIEIPENVKVDIEGQKITLSGEKGKLSLLIRPEIKVEKKDNKLKLSRISDSKLAKSLHGLYRNLIFNLIEGVTKGYEKQLKIYGVGFRANVLEDEKGQRLSLVVGFSHPVEIKAEEEINFKVTKDIITVSGIDKQKVGEIAAKIKKVKVPDSYKGKGIRYIDEIIKKKPGKAVVKVAGV